MITFVDHTNHTESNGLGLIAFGFQLLAPAMLCYFGVTLVTVEALRNVYTCTA